MLFVSGLLSLVLHDYVITPVTANIFQVNKNLRLQFVSLAQYGCNTFIYIELIPYYTKPTMFSPVLSQKTILKKAQLQIIYEVYFLPPIAFSQTSPFPLLLSVIR